MIKHLYVNGDSCMWGQGAFPDVPLTESWKHSWSATLAKMINLDVSTQYTNHALPGGSNDRIVRTTIQGVLNLLKRYDASEILVVIGWTDADRIERFFSSKNRYFSLVPNSQFEKTFPTSVRVYNNIWLSSMRDIYESAERYFSQIVLLQSFLKSKGVNYIFTQAVAAFADLNSFNIRENLKYFDNLEVLDEHIEWDKFLYETHLYEYHRSFPDHKMSSCQHPDKVGYDRWAKYVYDKFGLVTYELDH